MISKEARRRVSVGCGWKEVGRSHVVLVQPLQELLYLGGDGRHCQWTVRGTLFAGPDHSASALSSLALFGCQNRLCQMKT
jgi:hypothetical protein